MKFLSIIQDSWSLKFNNNRALLPLNGYTCLEGILKRLGRIQEIDDVVLITSQLVKDDKLAEFANSIGLSVFRGDERDVLSRTLLPIEALNPEYVIKVSGNNPLIDSNHIQKMIRHIEGSSFDMATNECRGSIIRGLGAEVIRAKTLKEIDTERLTPFQREFHTQFIKQNPERFKIFESRSPLSRTEYSLSLDIRRDYLLIKEIVALLGGNADEAAIVSLLDANPHLVEINARPPSQEVCADKLMLFPDKLKKFHAIVKKNISHDISYPINVELSLTDRCQLHCIWCSDRELRRKEAATIDTSVVMRLADDLRTHGTKGVVIEGGGEPTLHPDFNRIVRHLAGIGLSLGLITNGLLPLPPEIISCFEWIRVSLDACNEKEFRALKGSDGFGQVISNIQTMVSHCPVVGVGYVLTNQNHDALENLIFLLQKINVSYLQIRPVVDHPNLTLRKNISYLRDFTYHSFPILLNALSENASSGNGGLPCYTHSLTTVISSSGNVFICGRLNIHNWLKPLGNIAEIPFFKIWNGPERKKQAQQILDASFCKANCPQCRMAKFNLLIDKQINIKTKNFI
ncbi:radical SAM protein [uncultured Desulfobacter sp.]|uniref:radical SAM protein n=1 Tax=uncultured Desulfobacter sp. TaxID=240139 RepID=UPI0029F5285C|nr:radical SAM protein [uncultured Desulfobacter sp.]